MENENIIKNSTDRLSGLPDSILHYILSFLDPKSIVRTSTLSKQWKYTWIQGSTLPLDSSTFRSEPSFETYIHKVLSRRSPSNLHKLSLTDYQDFKQEDYNIFVDVLKYAFAHNVQHLEINLQKCCLCWEESDYSFSDLFASTISQHRSLKSLDLVFIIIDIGFRSSGFEMLKDLELHGCWFTSKRDQVFDFFSGLPCLENLWLDGVHSNDENDELKIFRVSGLQLRTLNISNNQLCRIAINAPNLKSFIFHNLYTIAEFTEMDLSSLDHADVLIDDDSVDDDELIEYAQYLINFFAGLGNVKSLVLHSTTLEILRCISQALKDEPSPFTRLETLQMDEYKIPYRLVSYFLKGSSCASPIIKAF
ncbi:Putative F-box/LRR-repeat protein At3g18150 [Linum perenne]